MLAMQALVRWIGLTAALLGAAIVAGCARNDVERFTPSAAAASQCVETALAGGGGGAAGAAGARWGRGPLPPARRGGEPVRRDRASGVARRPFGRGTRQRQT